MQVPSAVMGTHGDLLRPDHNMHESYALFDGGDSLASAPDAGAALDPQRKSGRTRTVRVRDGFFDSNLLHYVALQDDAGAAAAGAAAGAGAEEALYQPSRRSPLPGGAGRPSTRATRVSDNNYEEEDDRPVGPKFQVTSIPAWRPRPAKPTAAEAKFLPAAPLYEPTAVVPAVAATPTTNSKTRAGRAGVTVPMPPVGVAASSSDFRYKYRWAKDSAGRRKLLHAAVNALDKQLGPEMVKVLGLERVGYKYAATWEPHEELLFCLGMCDKYRMFKYIRQCFLFNRSAHELNGYYHNVWKTRSTELADEFLTMRDEEATREEFLAFVDKVRDQLTAIWDRKTMGDMPKILKDIATAARAAPRSAKERNKRVELLGSSGEDEEQEEEEDNAGAASDSSTETADDSDSSGRRARSKQKQRKRAGSAAAAAAAAAGSGRGAKRPRYNHNAPYRRPVSGVPLQQWGYAGQRARNAARAGQMPGGGLFEAPKGQLPMMPTLPRPDVRNRAAIAAWLKALPDFKASLSSYVDTVNSMTDTAVQDCQNYITQLQEQRSQVKEQAEGYLKMLLAQGQEVLAAMTGQPLPPPQPQPPLQPPQSQAEVLQQVLIKQEAAAAAAAALQGAGAISNSSRPPSAAASDGSMQQQPLADAGGIVPDAMPHAVRGGATDSHQQQQDQQPLPMPQPATGGADAAPLPFPGGPLSKWLNPRMQAATSSEAVVVKHIPRPYLKR